MCSIEKRVIKIPAEITGTYLIDSVNPSVGIVFPYVEIAISIPPTNKARAKSIERI
jgi:hypothetical protein